MNEILRESRDQLEKLREIVFKLVTPDGDPLPGVTLEQLQEASRVLDEYTELHRRYAKEYDKISGEQDNLAVDVNKTRAKMRRAEKLTGVKFPPLLRGMYRL